MKAFFSGLLSCLLVLADGFVPHRFLPAGVAMAKKQQNRLFVSLASDTSPSIVKGEDEGDDDVTTVMNYEDRLLQLLQAQKDQEPFSVQTLELMKQAENVVEEMMRVRANHELDTNTQNILLRMQCLTKDDDGILFKAQAMLDSMKAPNQESHAILMDAYAQARDFNQTELVFERLLARYNETQDEAFYPDVYTCNRLLKAYMYASKVHHKQVTDKAVALLEKMMREKKAEARSFIYVMRTFRLANQPGCVDKVRHYLKEQEEYYYETGYSDVTIHSYNELVATMGENSQHVTNGYAKAERVLYELLEQQKENPLVRPDAATFRHVMYAYQNCPIPTVVAYKVEKLLELQKATLLDPLPSQQQKNDLYHRNYNAAIQIVAKSRDPRKVFVVWRLFQEMLREDGRPGRPVYNAVLNACAHPHSNDDAKNIFLIAVDVLHMLRRATDVPHVQGPDHVTYGHFLHCCSLLLPEGHPKRDAIVRGVFRGCCKRGYVGKFVVTELIKAASDDLLVELFGTNPKHNDITIPRSWSRSLKDRRQFF